MIRARRAPAPVALIARRNSICRSREERREKSDDVFCAIKRARRAVRFAEMTRASISRITSARGGVYTV